MESTHSDARAKSPGAPPAKSSSPVRLLVLLGILVLALGALAYDHFVAKPGAEAAYAKLQQVMVDQNAASAATTRRLTSEEIQKEIGKAPTKRIVDEDYTVEYYCWWGPVPFINTYRQYLTVVFVGDDPRRINSVYLNEYPPKEELSPRFWESTAPPEGVASSDVGAEDMGSGAEGPTEEGAPDEGKSGKKGKKGKKAKSDEASDADAPTDTDAPGNADAPADQPADAPAADTTPATDAPAEDKPTEDPATEQEPADEAAAEKSDNGS